MRIKFPACLLVIFSIWNSLFAPFVSAQNPTPQPPKVGLEFRLTEAPKMVQSTATPTPEPLQVENLSQAEAEAILQRLPPMPENAETSDFKMRSDSLKPPKTGDIIPLKFPADEKRDAPKLPTKTNKPLQIERFSPDGATPLVSDLSVTFSQPMIAVSSQVQASEIVPVKLTPEVKGKWRWLGTNTLLFDAETRFPMATKFTATIPKGTKSVIGGVLNQDFTWTFTTPSPKIEAFAPKTEHQGIFPEYAFIAAKFNQEIDVNAVLPKIRVVVDGKDYPVKLEETQVNYTSVQQLGEFRSKQTIVFRTVENLPLNSEVTVIFGKGLPSAEGAGVSENLQVFSFKTMGEFKVASAFCGYNQDAKNCQPSDEFRIRFSRSFSTAPFDKSLVKIEPPIENAEIIASNGELVIRGKKKPNTAYKITLSGEAIDFYKQKVGKDISVDFNVTTEQPQFFAQGGDFVTLDPNARQVFSIYSKNQPNFKVRLYAVTVGDFPNFGKFLNDFRNNRTTLSNLNFGKLIFDKTVETKSETDVLTETRIDVSEALPKKKGHTVLIAEPSSQKIQDNLYQYYNRPIVTWIQATNIGIDALVDYEKLTAFVTDLKSGKPLGNTEMTLHGYQTTLNAVTDANGMANFSQPEYFSGSNLIAKNGEDTAILSNNLVDWRIYKRADSMRWTVFDDRKMYRPNEEVSIKGYVRKVMGGKFTDIAEIGEMAKTVQYVLRDPRNNEIVKGTTELNAFGAFDFKIKLPENINLGYQYLQFWADKVQDYPHYYPHFQHSFQVQEFRRPEFEVSVEAETPAPYLVGNSATISAEAKYYTGGFLQNSPMSWYVIANQTTYSPPNHEGWTFGTFVPWWRSYPRENASRAQAQNIAGTTDSNGKHRVNLDFISAIPARPYTLRSTASTQDVNRQTIADTKTFLVHPSNVYVGLRSPKTFVRQDEKLKIEAIATDIDGKIVETAPIELKAELKNWRGNQQTVVDTQTCQIKSAKDAVSCEFTAKEGGVFTISATVLDEKERPNTSEITVWVAGGNFAPKRGVERETAELIPDKKEYSPNETAEILVNAPFYPAEGVLTLERNGIIKTERFSISEPSKVLQIPIEEAYLPNFHVKVDLVGVTDRTNDKGEIDKNLPKRPAIAKGELNLNVSKASRKLNVVIEPIEKTLEPGGKTNINIEVKDNLGKPVANSEVALVAVDESVLALTNYKIQNPLDVFYQPIQANVAHHHSRERVVLGNGGDIVSGENEKTVTKKFIGIFDEANASSFSIDGLSGDGRMRQVKKEASREQDTPFRRMEILTSLQRPPVVSNAPINLRRNFDALAIFSPSVVTDAKGKATVNMKLPDNLTRYRITAVAVTKSKQFGLGESNITAKQSLQVRPSAPRFLNFGDKAEIPVVLQNQTNSPMTISVAIRASNAILTNGNGRKVTIPAQTRAEVRFPVASEKAGTAIFQIGAIGGSFTDAAQIAFPIYTPATTESFATYGTTEANGAIVQSISAPKDAYRDFGGLEITTSSTQLQELTDAFIYLQNYPFECSEQISSRMLSVAALRDVLTAFKAKEMPSKLQIEAKMNADIARLQTLQHQDGGFSFWRNNDESIPYLSVHVAHALARARAKGYGVSNDIVAKSLNYLKNIEAKLPETYSQESRWAISAYALFVRDLLNDKDSAKAKKLLQDVGLEKLSAESIGWILSVLADDKNSTTELETIKRHLLNRVTETAGTAHFVTNYRDGEYVLLSSERRADGVILEALLRVSSLKSQVSSDGIEDLIPKVVRGLLANRTKGRWQSTQENAFVLLALDKYFQTFEKATPNFVTKVWLGNSFAGEQKFVGRVTDSNLINVPMSYLQTQNTAQNLILDKQGAGRLYYRIGLKYAPKNLNIAAADYGFAVSRSYEAIDNPNDVKQNADGSWTIKAGARVRINVQMVAPTRRYHVALVDNLPAGFEAINPGLATSGNNYLKYSDELRRRSFWFNHQNLRDNRAEAFTMLLREGVWNYSYLARATTIGNFVTPPAKAEEMYAPETFGRCKTDFVKVE